MFVVLLSAPFPATTGAESGQTGTGLPERDGRHSGGRLMMMKQVAVVALVLVVLLTGLPIVAGMSHMP